MLASITALISAAALAAAAPGSSPPSLATRQQEAPLAKWPAINFSAGCAPHAGGCIALFNISAPAGYIARAPAFAVTCHPLVPQKGFWLNCDDHTDPANPSSHVETTWGDGSQGDLIKVSVAHIWTEASGQRNNASGSAEIDGGMATFEVPVTMLTAVL
ncbi:hypothetical protein PG984_009256 [Apiospora sp. TS-2023a]